MAEDDPKISTDLLLKLHAGLEVLKAMQSEINRRLGKLEAAMEAEERARAAEVAMEIEDAKAPKWKEWFWQAVFWSVGITAAVTVGRLFGVEVSW